MDFYTIRDELIASKKKFTADIFQQVPYAQLPFCCIGNASASACTQKLVQQEQVRRRERFLNMQPEELAESADYLKMEGMYEDITHAIAYRNAPKWESLNDRQKAWTILLCISNHIDEPHQRLQDCFKLLQTCAVTSLPSEVAMDFMRHLKHLQAAYPDRLSEETFRDKIDEIMDSLFDFLPDVERPVLEREEFQGYSCTSDCFRTFV